MRSADWTEEDSRTFLSIAPVAVPRRDEQMATLMSLVPCAPTEPCRIVEIGCGDGRLAAALLEAFPQATLTALDGSPSMRTAAATRLTRFGDRARVVPFDLATVDWWEALFGADVVVSALTLHHLNEAKTQYVYKAIADRISARGALLIADLIAPSHPSGWALAADAWDGSAREQAAALDDATTLGRFDASHWNHYRHPDPADRPAALFHHLVWLRHAGFAAVDCWWMYAGHAVFGAHKSAERAPAGVSYAAALELVRQLLSD
ncbi:MAG TPA: class I SAM-dependent methyltransferase [Vicinamibacterales bacterium]|jgi:tRNA (cmo5U34)-methyltransferase|nr:class I SAM-dependent methyltransferase [Vicinamibacterales bacterium]